MDTSVFRFYEALPECIFFETHFECTKEWFQVLQDHGRNPDVIIAACKNFYRQYISTMQRGYTKLMEVATTYHLYNEDVHFDCLYVFGDHATALLTDDLILPNITEYIYAVMDANINSKRVQLSGCRAIERIANTTHRKIHLADGRAVELCARARILCRQQADEAISCLVQYINLASLSYLTIEQIENN
jgi:hypothetical protein